MFGCCSLTSQNTVEGWALFTRLKRSGQLHSEFNLLPRENYICEDSGLGEEDIVDTKLPRLMRLYLDYGAKICSQPAIDREFKTIDYLALFDFQDIPDKLMKVFKKDIA
jgi:putative hemolysin